jgi:hypothetical protein
MLPWPLDRRRHRRTEPFGDRLQLGLAPAMTIPPPTTNSGFFAASNNAAASSTAAGYRATATE